MIIIACLIWVGVQLGAPTTFYILLGLHTMLRILSFGIKMGEKK